MNPLNRVEAVGIFLSIAVMAIALSVIRFKTDILAESPALEGGVQTAVVAVGQDEESLQKTLIEAADSSGEIVRLVVDDVRIGGGREAEPGDTLTVHYVGTMPDGVKFDSSYDRGEPFTFTVGEGRVIEGWEKGLIGMREGGSRILVVPSTMAYGNRQVGLIAPNSTLVFAIELLKVE